MARGLNLMKRRERLLGGHRSINEAGELLGISRNQVRKLIASGKILAVKVGCLFRIPEEEMKRILREGTDGPAVPKTRQPELATA